MSKASFVAQNWVLPKSEVLLSLHPPLYVFVHAQIFLHWVLFCASRFSCQKVLRAALALGLASFSEQHVFEKRVPFVPLPLNTCTSF